MSQSTITELPDDAGAVLLTLARGAIGARLGLSSVASGPSATGNDSWLDRPGATFVTLRLGQDLRGCIGSLMAHRPLRRDVQDNALAAAFQDPRFRPLTVPEFHEMTVEVSVLSAPEPISYSNRAEALAALRPGIDGVVLTAAGRRATFLPQVWDELPDREVFIAHLLRKAGLPAGFWDDSVRLERYTVTAFEE